MNRPGKSEEVNDRKKVYFLAFLFVSYASFCFLHLFVSGSSLFVSPNRLFIDFVSSFISLSISIGSFLFVYFCEFDLFPSLSQPLVFP